MLQMDRCRCSPLFRRVVVKLSSTVVDLTPFPLPLASMLAALSFAEMVVPFRPTTGVTESLVITCLVLPANILVSIATILLAIEKIRRGSCRYPSATFKNPETFGVSFEITTPTSQRRIAGGDRVAC